MPKFAILMQGTFRETTFLCNLLPYIVGDYGFDLYLCLRRTESGELGRLAQPEKHFSYHELLPILHDNVFLCVLPTYERDFIFEKYVLPVGPDTLENEIHAISMFLGIFAGVRQIKASGRKYDYIVRTRTDYLFWDAPLFDLGVKIHEKSGGKILVDAQRKNGFRYQDKPYLPWQGSISELFTFSSQEQFFQLWDFEEKLAAIWTGVSETTFFRNALFRFTGENVQHPRKNKNFIKRYFYIIPGSVEQSNYYFRQDVLPEEIKILLINLIEDSKLPPQQNLRLVRSTHQFFSNPDHAEEGKVFKMLDDVTSPRKDDFLRELGRYRG